MARDYDALIRYLAEQGRMPFDWKTNSCAHFAAGAVLAQTGRDVMPLLPHWTTELGARRVIKRAGGLDKITDGILRRIHPSQARRGDIAGVQLFGEAGLLLMVVEGETLVMPPTDGVSRLPRTAMSVAWSAEPPEAAE